MYTRGSICVTLSHTKLSLINFYSEVWITESMASKQIIRRINKNINEEKNKIWQEKRVFRLTNHHHQPHHQYFDCFNRMNWAEKHQTTSSRMWLAAALRSSGIAMFVHSLIHFDQLLCYHSRLRPPSTVLAWWSCRSCYVMWRRKTMPSSDAKSCLPKYPRSEIKWVDSFVYWLIRKDIKSKLKKKTLHVETKIFV